MHSHRPKVGGKYLAHKGFITKVDCHLLIEVAHMLYGIRPFIIDGECWLWKPVGKPGFVDSPNKGWLWDLSALLIASFPMLRWDDPCPRLNLLFFSLSWCEDAEKDSLDRVLNLWWYYNPYSPLIHHLMKVMDSFYQALFAAVSYISDLSQVSIFAFPAHAKHSSLSLSDFFRYTSYGRTLP